MVRSLRQQGRCNLISSELAGLVPAEQLERDRAEHAAYSEAHGLRHEQKLLPFQGLPYVLTQRAYEQATEKLRRLFPVLERVIDLYLEDPAAREFFRLAPRHDRLIRMGAAYRPRIQYCRYDFTLGPGATPRIYELNTHCPASAVFSYHLGQMLAHSRAWPGSGSSACVRCSRRWSARGPSRAPCSPRPSGPATCARDATWRCSTAATSP